MEKRGKAGIEKSEKTENEINNGKKDWNHKSVPREKCVNSEKKSIEKMGGAKEKLVLDRKNGRKKMGFVHKKLYKYWLVVLVIKIRIDKSWASSDKIVISEGKVTV